MPRYLTTRSQGRLKQKIAQAFALMDECTLCPRACRAHRPRNQTGFCGAGAHLQIHSFCPHFGEEPPLSGTKGSGTIFFTHCSLRCIFCQNYEISIQGEGERAETRQLAAIMLHLQEAGCHNINLVTPGHFLPYILEALDIAAAGGLTLPLVYNSSGYESLETLKILDGIVDIYLPDFKFWDPEIARNACSAPDYPAIAVQSIREMFRQVGDLKTDISGTAISGLLVRHLVLPEEMAGTRKIVDFLSKKISKTCTINVMSQYRPMHRAFEVAAFSRPVTVAEYRAALKIAEVSGLTIIC